MKIGDLVTLSDHNKYVVASITNHKEKTYLCLVDILDNKNIKYCYLDQDEVVILKEEELSPVLILKLTKEIYKFDFKKLIEKD